MHIAVKGTISVTDPNNAAYNKKLAFKNNAPFILLIHHLLIHLLTMQKT